MNLITCCATLGIKSCRKAFVIADDESFTSLWRNFGPLVFAELFEFNYVIGWFFKVMPKNLNQTESELWLAHSKTFILIYFRKPFRGGTLSSLTMRSLHVNDMFVHGCECAHVFCVFFLTPAVTEPAESLAMLVETLKYSFVAWFWA